VEDPVPSWSQETYHAVALGAAVVAVLCLLLLLVVLGRLRALSRRVRRSSGAARAVSDAGIDQRALRHVAVVRYDAFGDMGGRLSFSAALYDDNGDGLVISSINGRSETRTYAKPLVGLTSDHTLSPEEREAIEAAREV
jgi:hypothetical protein